MVVEPQHHTSDGASSTDRISIGIVQLRASTIAGNTERGGRGESGDTEQVNLDGKRNHSGEPEN